METGNVEEILMKGGSAVKRRGVRAGREECVFSFSLSDLSMSASLSMPVSLYSSAKWESLHS